MATSSTTKIQIPEVQRGRRRRFSDAEKRDLISEAFVNQESLSELGRRYGIAVGLLFRWQRALGLSRAAVAASTTPNNHFLSPSELRLAELEEQLSTLMRDNRQLHSRLAQIEGRPSEKFGQASSC